MLDMALIVTLVMLVLLVATAVAILVLRLGSGFGPDFPFLVGLLAGVSLSASAVVGLRLEPSPSEWLLLVMAALLMVANALAIIARRHKPELLYKRSSPPPAERVAELDVRLLRRDELRDLVSEGQRLHAIKLYMDDTGATLSEAKGIIDGMRPERIESA